MTTATIRMKIIPKTIIKGKMDVRFPARVETENFLTLVKENGTYRFGVDYTVLGPGSFNDLTLAMVAVLDRETGAYKTVTLADVLASLDPDLNAIAALTGAGVLVRTGTNTWALRSVIAPAAGIAVINGDGVSGNPTLALANDLAAVEGLSSTGIAARTAADTWAVRTITGPAAGITVTNGGGVAGNPTLALANDLAALEGLSGTGIARRTGTDTWSVGTAVSNAELATVADGTIKSNISGATAAPSDNTISAVLDKLLASTHGNVVYRGASGWAGLAPGAAGQFLTTQGAGADPNWSSVGAGATPRYIGFYNGNGGDGIGGGAAAVYNIGVAVGSNPLTFGRKSFPSLISSYATTYKDLSGKICPQPILVGERIYVYYEGYNGTNKSIFLEIFDKEGDLQEKPIEPVILFSQVAGSSTISRPAVLYEPSDAAAPFKMIFSRATSGVDCTSLYAATSLDGVNWTILGSILAISSGWESTFLETSGRFLKDGNTYRLFYSGHNGTFWQSGELFNAGTFGTSGWTKNPANPLLAPRGGYDIAITNATSVAGTKTVTVANSALFDVGAPIAVYAASGSYQLNRIAAIPNGTTLTCLYTWEGGYSTANSAKISQIHSRSVELSEVWFDSALSKWRSIITGFQFVNGYLVETTGYAET